MGSFDGTEEDVSGDNSVIKNIEKDSKGNLIVNLIKKNSTLMGKSYIKPISSIGPDVSVLEEIFLSKNVIGKTLNEIRDMKSEDL